MNSIKEKFTLAILVVLIAIALALPIFATDASKEIAKSSAKQFQEALQYANTLRSTVHVTDKKLHTGTTEFKPHEIFKNQKGGYSEEPPETTYYQTQRDIRNMEEAALDVSSRVEETKDSEGNLIASPGKTVLTSFQTRPIFKLGEYIKKGRKEINCEEATTQQCTEAYVEKTCNETVRTIKKICDNVPELKTASSETIYPNCRSLIITQHVNNHCPPGYNQDFASDMVRTRGNNWDDIRFCTKSAAVGESAECYSGGYYVARMNGGDYFGSGHAIVPKKLHSRIVINNVYYDPVVVTVVNNTTGQTLVNKEGFRNGATIQLPYSETQDQSFSFYATKTGWFSRITGTIVLYIEHVNKEKVVNVTWKESCREI